MTVTTRFAPSPTGRLHVGNIRTALHNALFARANGGRFLLRIDDTDAERSTEAFVDAIHADLAWLGLAPDGVVRQSERFALYEREFDRLQGGGPRLRLLRNPRRARPAPQGPARPRPAAGLRAQGRRTRRSPTASPRTGASASTMTRRSNGTTSSAATRNSTPR